MNLVSKDSVAGGVRAMIASRASFGGTWKLVSAFKSTNSQIWRERLTWTWLLRTCWLGISPKFLLELLDRNGFPAHDDFRFFALILSLSDQRADVFPLFFGRILSHLPVVQSADVLGSPAQVSISCLRKPLGLD